MARRTLITIAIALTIVAFVAAEADFWGDGDSGQFDHYTSTLLTSFRVGHRGDFELDESQSAIVAMSSDAYLDIAERRFLTRRRLRVRAGDDGQPAYELEVGSRERSEAEAREFLATVMPRVVRSTTIGARARAERILASDGLEALLREVSLLDSNAARRIYLEEATSLDDLTEEQARRIIGTAGREMTSSSRLRSVLVHVAEELPAEWTVTGDLAMAAEMIRASSEKRAALVEIVRLRGIEPVDVRPLAEAIGTIPASSEKGNAIVRIARLEPSPEVVEGLFDPVERIDSSSERRRVLDELTIFPGLSDRAYERALDVGYGIASSSEKASFLVNLTRVLPRRETLYQDYLDLAATIPATSERARALAALLRSADLSPSICAAWIRTAGEVPATSTAASLLVEAAEYCPADGRVWRDYLAAVERIPASSEQRRTLMALLERDDLDPELIAEVSTVAESAIASSSERGAVMDRAEQLIDNWVEREPEIEPDVGQDGALESDTETAMEAEPESGDEPPAVETDPDR